MTFDVFININSLPIAIGFCGHFVIAPCSMAWHCFLPATITITIESIDKSMPQAVERDLDKKTTSTQAEMVAINKSSIKPPTPEHHHHHDEESGSSSSNTTAPLLESSALPKKATATNDFKDAAFWLFMLFVASVTMTVGNKYVMKQWDYANTLTLMQNGTAVLYLGVGRYLGMLDMKPFAAQQWKVFAVSSFFLAMQILTSLKALPFVAIATVVAFRNTCTVIIAIIDYLVFGNKFNKAQIMSLAVTTAGMILYAVQDINFHVVGYLWLVGNSVATIINTFWNKFYITHYTKDLKIQTSYGVSFIQQVETLPIVFVLATMNNEGEAFAALNPLSAAAKFMVFGTCLGGVLIGIAYPKCFSLVSGTSVVVASTANKAVSILIGMWLFGTRLSMLQVVGLLVCIVGSLWYALEGNRGKK
jgi:drug/metabolite transporter (DMT)-like permease